MRKYILGLIIIVFITSSLKAQTDWQEVKLGSGFSVKCPSKPVYKVTGKAGVYTSKTDNCFFITIVQYDVMPNYTQFVKLPQSQQNNLINILLDNTVNGILKASGNEGAVFKKISIEKFKGREMTLQGINPSNGEQTTKYYKLFYAFDKVYLFQCLYQLDEVESERQKNIYLNSISKN